MRIRPFRTFPLRVGLDSETLRNSIEKRRESTAPTSRPARSDARRSDAVLEVLIHPYALIGHQVAGWISGYLWARDLGLPYSGGAINRDPDGLFNFEVVQTDLPRQVRGRAVRLRATGEEGPGSLLSLQTSLARALRRHRTRPLRVRLSLDQARHDHTPASDAVRAAVLAGSQGDRLRALEAGDRYVAVHVRRPAYAGEISASANPDRWLTLEWYAGLIGRLQQVPELAGVPVRVYSLGERSGFAELEGIPGVELHLNGERDVDFVELAAADLLVCAPSSFSFTAGLTSHRAVMARSPWWHATPNAGRWTVMDHDGMFSLDDVQRALRAPRVG